MASCDTFCRLKDTRSRKPAITNVNDNYPEKDTNSSKYYSRGREYLLIESLWTAIMARACSVGEAHHADALADGCRQRAEDMHSRVQPLYQRLITLSGFIERICLLLEYI